MVENRAIVMKMLLWRILLELLIVKVKWVWEVVLELFLVYLLIVDCVRKVIVVFHIHIVVEYLRG